METINTQITKENWLAGELNLTTKDQIYGAVNMVLQENHSPVEIEPIIEALMNYLEKIKVNQPVEA